VGSLEGFGKAALNGHVVGDDFEIRIDEHQTDEGHHRDTTAGIVGGEAGSSASADFSERGGEGVFHMLGGRQAPCPTELHSSSTFPQIPCDPIQGVRAIRVPRVVGARHERTYPYPTELIMPLGVPPSRGNRPLWLARGGVFTPWVGT